MSLEKLLERMGERIGQGVEYATAVGGRMGANILREAKALGGEIQERFVPYWEAVTAAASTKYRNIERAVVDALHDERLAAVGKDIVDGIQSGSKSVKEGVRAKYAGLQDYLNELAQTNPHRAGLWDGIFNAYLGVSANRRPKSKLYTTGVMYGKIIGYGSSVGLLLGGRMLLAAIPVISRAVTYFIDQYKRAADETKTPH